MYLMLANCMIYNLKSLFFIAVAVLIWRIYFKQTLVGVKVVVHMYRLIYNFDRIVHINTYVFISFKSFFVSHLIKVVWYNITTDIT